MEYSYSATLPYAFVGENFTVYPTGSPSRCLDTPPEIMYQPFSCSQFFSSLFTEIIFFFLRFFSPVTYFVLLRVTVYNCLVRGAGLLLHFLCNIGLPCSASLTFSPAGGDRILRNVVNFLQNYTASRFRRRQSTYLPQRTVWCGGDALDL